nr:cupin domain-containing protein [Actinomyces oris]
MTATIDETVFNAENIFGKGEANTAFAQYFTGESFLRALVTDPECAVSVHNVTFEPGCRNNWHIHHATSGGGQVLICTAGSGWYQEEGHDAVSLEPGAVIFTRAGIKHWHGAKADSWFSHIALGVPGENTSNEWLQPVDDAHYDALGGSRP